jgi:hypothetical protein
VFVFLKDNKAQAAVLTVVILIVMVVFSIYAMSEYSIVIQEQQQNISPSTTFAISSSSASVSLSSITAIATSTAACSECSYSSATTGSSMAGPGGTINAGVSEISSSTNALLACPVPAEGNLVLTAYDSLTGTPLNGLAVQATDEFSSCGNPLTTIALRSSSTNSSGMDSLCCNAGAYKLKVEYENSVYSAEANVSTGGLTCVSLFIPSGKVSIFYSATIRSLCSQGS